MAVEIDPSYMKHKKGIQKGMFTCFRILSYFIAAVLFYILGFIIVKGISVINWDFLTQAPTDGMTKGGILPAIVGTFYLMIGSAVFSFPVGVMSGIYMNEYAPKGKMVNFIRTMTNNLAGIPSIVFGLFGMAFFVNYLDFGDSIMTIWKVLLPMAMPRIITGLILSLGRVSGETAPILFTCAAYFLPKLPESIFDQCMALPYHLYVIATSGTDIEAQTPIAYGTAFVLIVIVLIMNLLANNIRKYFENKLKSK